MRRRRRRGDNERQGDRMKECKRRRACQESRGVVCPRLPHGAMSSNLLTKFYYKGLYVRVCVVSMPTNLCQLEGLSVSTRCTVWLIKTAVRSRNVGEPRNRLGKNSIEETIM